MKVGTNKILLEEVVLSVDKSAITLPDHLQQKKYQVIEIGKPRTTLDNVPDVSVGQIIQILPSAGWDLSLNGKKSKVVSYDDVMIVF